MHSSEVRINEDPSVRFLHRQTDFLLEVVPQPNLPLHHPMQLLLHFRKVEHQRITTFHFASCQRDVAIGRAAWQTGHGGSDDAHLYFTRWYRLYSGRDATYWRDMAL